MGVNLIESTKKRPAVLDTTLNTYPKTKSELLLSFIARSRLLLFHFLPPLPRKRKLRKSWSITVWVLIMNSLDNPGTEAKMQKLGEPALLLPEKNKLNDTQKRDRAGNKPPQVDYFSVQNFSWVLAHNGCVWIKNCHPYTVDHHLNYLIHQYRQLTLNKFFEYYSAILGGRDCFFFLELTVVRLWGCMQFHPQTRAGNLHKM